MVIREHHPDVTIRERTVVRARVGGDVNVRGNFGSRETTHETTGSGSRMSQGSVSGGSKDSSRAKGSGESQAGAGRQIGGASGNQSGSSTTGQGTR